MTTSKDQANSFEHMADKLAESYRQLVEQASKLEAVLNSIGDGVIVLDLDEKIVTSNLAADRILTDMSSDFPSGPIRELPSILFAHPDYEDADTPTDLSSLKSTRRFRVGGRVLSASASPVQSPDGTNLGTVLILRDITREAEAENLKDSFIASISHELRTPLTAIKGYSELLIRLFANEDDSSGYKFAQAINHNTNQLMQHINGLIDMSQIQSGDLRLEKEKVRFEELVKDAVNRWRVRMESKELALTVHPLPENIWTYADRDRLFWAVHNLLSNAYNYTLPGGQVEVALSVDDELIRLEIKDTGVGIAANDQHFLFSRFFRARNELTFSVPGVGLGLFITRSIIEMHKGHVWAESELGIGSTFIITLPLLVGELPIFDDEAALNH